MTELLQRWRDGDLSDEELVELTKQLESPEAREQLRRDWILETMLPEALKTARIADLASGRGLSVASSLAALARWWRSLLPAPRWAISGMAAAIVALAVFALADGNGTLVASNVQNTECMRGGISRPVTDRMRLVAGDVLRTGENGCIEMVFPNEGTRIRLKAGTTVEIRTLDGRKEFRLLSGSVDADVAHQTSGAMEWVTEDAKAKVVGTKFILSAAGLFTRLDVSEGAVVFEQLVDARPTTVRAGEFAAADSQTLVEARPITGADSLPWKVTGKSSPGFSHTSFRSPALDREIGVNVMLPPDYASHPPRRFPVVYLLHGLGGDEHSEAVRFGPGLLVAMREEQIPPCIVVTVNSGPAFSRNVVDVGRMISRELTGFIDSNYRTLPYRKTRVVCGVGFGAQLAAVLASLHPDVFSIGCAIDDTLRGGTPALERMAPQMRSRSERTPAHIVLLATDRHSAGAEQKLAGFFSGAGVKTTVERLAASNLDDPALPTLVFNSLAPILTQQWKRTP